MKRSEAIRKIYESEADVEVAKAKRLQKIRADMDVENLMSNINRARSVTVGTSFGGTTEIMMRSDGGRHIWCAMQPVEVVELIHQLAANVGCSADVKPRKDFASWRDWRVSEAEKKHLNGHAPFPNDMAVVQRLGASGFDEDAAARIMDIIAGAKEYANENDNAVIVGQQQKSDGAPSLMLSEEDGLVHNKVLLHNNEVIYVAGGNGGVPDQKAKKRKVKNETVATNKSQNGRKAK